MRRLVFFLVLTSNYVCNCEESEQYLQNAVRDLRKINFRQTLRRADTKLLEDSVTKPSVIEVLPTKPSIERRVVHSANQVPPLSLTKGELAALYENAVAKGETIKLNAGDNSFVHAAVAELDGSESKIHAHENTPNHSDDTAGYYYYYYPIKSFIDELSSQPSGSERVHFPSHPSEGFHKHDNDIMDHYKPHDHKDNHGYSDHHDYHDISSYSHNDDHHDHHNHHDHHEPDSSKPQYQYHSHHHQHNINITHVKADMAEKKTKPLEPLFMAISGFIGMAVMFVFSVLLLPKFSIKNPSGGSIKKTSKNERISDIARIALSAIEGQDCTERFACELGKTARSFNLQENRFVKLLKRMAPSTFGKQMDKVGRYSNKRLKCTAIPCKKKPSKEKNSQKKNAQKKS